MTELRLRASLGGLAVKSATVVTKLVKLGLAVGSVAAYTWLFTWQFAVIILGMLVIHEGGHLAAMKHFGMKTKGMYLIPFLGAAAVADEQFPSYRTEALTALAGPVTGAALAGLAGIAAVVTGSGWLAAIAAWFALINLFNLLPVNPLDGGRVFKAVSGSLSSRLGAVVVTLGLLGGAVLALTQNLIIFVVVIPLGLLDYFAEKVSYWRLLRRHAKLRREALGMYANLALIGPVEKIMTEDEFMAKLPPPPEPPRRLPPLSKRGSAAVFAGYAALAACLWLLMVKMGTTPGAAAAMRTLQG